MIIWPRIRLLPVPFPPLSCGQWVKSWQETAVSCLDLGGCWCCGDWQCQDDEGGDDGDGLHDDCGDDTDCLIA